MPILLFEFFERRCSCKPNDSYQRFSMKSSKTLCDDDEDCKISV